MGFSSLPNIVTHKKKEEEGNECIQTHTHIYINTYTYTKKKGTVEIAESIERNTFTFYFYYFKLRVHLNRRKRKKREQVKSICKMSTQFNCPSNERVRKEEKEIFFLTDVI